MHPYRRRATPSNRVFNRRKDVEFTEDRYVEYLNPAKTIDKKRTAAAIAPRSGDA